MFCWRIRSRSASDGTSRSFKVSSSTDARSASRCRSTSSVRAEICSSSSLQRRKSFSVAIEAVLAQIDVGDRDMGALIPLRKRQRQLLEGIYQLTISACHRSGVFCFLSEESGRGDPAQPDWLYCYCATGFLFQIR